LLPLHIFEPRYRAMIKFCLDQESEFGVVLVKEGEAISESTIPNHVGTAARILHAEHLDDGRINILTAGEYRFQILAIDEELSYLTSRVKILEDWEAEAGTIPETVSAQIEELYKAYEALSTRLIFAWQPPEEIPVCVKDLASQIAIRLRIPLEHKQTLLEIGALAELLRREIEILTDQNQRLASQLAARNN